MLYEVKSEDEVKATCLQEKTQSRIVFLALFRLDELY